MEKEQKIKGDFRRKLQGHSKGEKADILVCKPNINASLCYALHIGIVFSIDTMIFALFINIWFPLIKYFNLFFLCVTTRFHGPKPTSANA